MRYLTVNEVFKIYSRVMQVAIPTLCWGDFNGWY